MVNLGASKLDPGSAANVKQIGWSEVKFPNWHQHSAHPVVSVIHGHTHRAKSSVKGLVAIDVKAAANIA